MELSTGTRVLITGANGGLGQAMARAFHRAGATLVLSGRRADALAGVAEETAARVLVADLARREDLDRLHHSAEDMDVVVFNAALPGSGALLDYTPEQIDKVLEVNLRGPIQGGRFYAERMVARGRGSLVFISSISGKVATQGQSLYNATKFGLRGFALALREDLRGTGVGVSTVFPGFIRDAGMFADTGVKLPAGAGTRTPEDVARAVLRAVRDDVAEIDVAAFEQVLGGYLFPLAPGLVNALQRASGGGAIAQRMADAQRHKR